MDYDNLIQENEQLRDHLQWCYDILESMPPEPCHNGPCSPPATPCDGSCQDAYYFNVEMAKIGKILN